MKAVILIPTWGGDPNSKRARNISGRLRDQLWGKTFSNYGEKSCLNFISWLVDFLASKSWFFEISIQILTQNEGSCFKIGMRGGDPSKNLAVITQEGLETNCGAEPIGTTMKNHDLNFFHDWPISRPPNLDFSKFQSKSLPKIMVRIFRKIVLNFRKIEIWRSKKFPIMN